jgi:cell division protein ZapA (FtsZ GTPase activity inhibitor)
MSDEDTVTVTILDRKYHFVCPKDEHEMFHACIALLDSRMRTVRKKSKVHTTERIAIMASLTLARDFLSSGKAVENNDQQKLEYVENILNEALTPQEKLFD